MLSSVLHKGPGVAGRIVQQLDSPGTRETTRLSREQAPLTLSQSAREKWMKRAKKKKEKKRKAGGTGIVRYCVWIVEDVKVDEADRDATWKKGKGRRRAWESGGLQLADRAVFVDARNQRNPHLWNEHTGPATSHVAVGEPRRPSSIDGRFGVLPPTWIREWFPGFYVEFYWELTRRE
ncbi:hypothetical protein QLX08_003568 [Tetragonisca angustula]|uniref:Uncharacterized protein n=1 Tax=Tetragonisca angustula TaxID=166442 RepID=A0AAW1A692_9HYME